MKAKSYSLKCWALLSRNTLLKYCDIPVLPVLSESEGSQCTKYLKWDCYGTWIYHKQQHRTQHWCPWSRLARMCCWGSWNYIFISRGAYFFEILNISNTWCLGDLSMGMLSMEEWQSSVEFCCLMPVSGFKLCSITCKHFLPIQKFWDFFFPPFSFWSALSMVR